MTLFNNEDLAALNDRCGSAFRNRRVFVTGGTGFFGKWLLTAIQALNKTYGLNCRVSVLSRDPMRFLRANPQFARDDRLEMVVGDVRTFDFPKADFDYVVHAATDADAGRTAADPATAFDVITAGTRRTIEMALARNCTRFLLVGSGAVYGAQPAELTHLPETYRGAPDLDSPAAAYGEGKRVAELLCRLHFADSAVEWSCARCFAFLAPHLPLDGSFAAGNFVGDLLAGREILIRGDGSPVRSYLYGTDLVEWLLTIAAFGRNGECYNVGSEEAVTLADFADRLYRAWPDSKRSPQAKPTSAVHALSPGNRYVPSTAKIQKDLGVGMRIPLDQAIIRTLDWHRAKTP